MTTDRVDELEKRIVQLESIVLELMNTRAPRLESSPLRHEEPVRQARTPPASASGTVEPRPVDPAPAEATPEIVSEQWLGQRGFLAVGVVAILVAVGYFLLLAFQRGWISPAVRSLGGAVLGLGVAGFGWRLYQRGLSRYGAALIGAGIGIDYLTAWAATRLYGFIPTASGALALAGLSALLAAIALLLDVQGLAAAAVVGGLLAPVLLGVGPGAGDLYLAYLGTMVLVMGGVAVSQQWRLTARLLAVGAALLLLASVDGGASALGLALYGATVGLAGILAGRHLGWGEVRLGGFLAGWGALLLGTVSPAPAPVPVLAGGLLMSLPAWLLGWRGDVAPWRMPGDTAEPRGEPRSGWFSRVANEERYFYATPVLLAVALGSALSSIVHPGLGYSLLLVGMGYLGVGLVTSRPAFELVGAVGLGFGSVVVASSPVMGYWYLLLQSLAWAGSDHLLNRTRGRWFALLPLAGAGYLLGGTVLPAPPAGDPAFIGQVSLASWAGIATGTILAAGLWRRADPNPRFRLGTVPQILAGITGLLILVGVTREIHWYFLHADIGERTRSLAGGLAVSAWWTLFAGVVVLIGFRLRTQSVRLAGLVVAGLAAAKVLAVDLAALEALYRVGSVMTLGAVFLGVSYLYNRAGQAGLGDRDRLP